MKDDSDKVPSLLTDYILKGEFLITWHSMLEMCRWKYIEKTSVHYFYLLQITYT